MKSYISDCADYDRDVIRLVFFCFLVLLFSRQTVANVFSISDALLESVRREYGKAAEIRMQDWKALLNDNNNKNLSETHKLRLVNDFFNTQKFIDDIDHWGKEDFWATPVEFLASGGGDCEDFSVAKYFTLIKLGIPDEKLRITYVMALEYKQAHMVLSYFEAPDTEPLILDNLNKMILPAGRRRDLKPIYNFNGDGLWVSRQRGSGKRVGQADDISRWMKLRTRFKETVTSKF
ncbi:transglutaminase-like cysteine peptidase [Endozoicomonas sp. Mp262]|uniref:transglutaminase-like cysteine peptidase n=1 Tax=Endozoicomonas sp. Mp262 TaxID=2919499 RepID=UPI0021DA189E